MTPLEPPPDRFDPDEPDSLPDTDAAPLHLVTGSEEDTRPFVRIEPAEVGRMVRQILLALSADPELYQRSGELVTITREPECAIYQQDKRRGREVQQQPDTPRIRPITLAGLKVRTTEYVRWVRWNEKAAKYKPAAPESTVVAGVLAADSLCGWQDIRPIRGIRETPFLSPSGRIVTAKGYDSETGYVLIPSIDVGEFAELPTRDQARAALKYLWCELFCDFPYRGLGESEATADKAKLDARYMKACNCPEAFVAVAAMLTVFSRAAIQGAVVSAAFEANTQGAGKSKQTHLISLVCTGRPAGTAAYPMTRDSKTNDEEMSKVLGSYARSGTSIVTFDNVKGEIGGGALEGAMTAEDSAPFRLLGTNDLVKMPWTAMMLFSGNNMVMSEDVAQRIMVSRLESEREDPRARPASEFRHPNITGWARENRPKLVRACLVVLRALMLADPKPDVGAVGSFESWSRIVPAAIVHAGGPNVIDARPRSESVDSGEGTAHSDLMGYWPSASFPSGCKTADLIRYAFEHERDIERGESPPDGLDDLRSAIRTLTDTPDGYQPSPKKLGSALRSMRGKWRNGRKIDSVEDRKGFAKWQVTERIEAAEAWDRI